MTAPATEPVTGRSIPRHRGKPVRHRLRWSAANRGASYREGGLIGRCDCGDHIVIDGGAPISKLVKAQRQHSGREA